MKRISKSISKKTTTHNVDLVNFTKEMYARIIVDICNHRKHDEDGGCDFDCVGRSSADNYEYKGKEVKLVYFPISGEDGWCEEAFII